MKATAVRALGRVSRIWRYPVKSLRGERLAIVRVDEQGLEGDRRRELVLATPGRPRTGKAYRGKEDERLHLLSEPSDALRAARARGLQLEERQGGPFFDDAPVSLIVDAWLREFEALAGMRLDPRRFRPNLFLEAHGTVPCESALVGSAVELGSALLRVASPIVRCVAITYDQETGDANPEVLRALAQHRDAVMGVYCTVTCAGMIEEGATALLRR